MSKTKKTTIPTIPKGDSFTVVVDGEKFEHIMSGDHVYCSGHINAKLFELAGIHDRRHAIAEKVCGVPINQGSDWPSVAHNTDPATNARINKLLLYVLQVLAKTKKVQLVYMDVSYPISPGGVTMKLSKIKPVFTISVPKENILKSFQGKTLFKVLAKKDGKFVSKDGGSHAWELGKWYRLNDAPSMCNKGFHVTTKPASWGGESEDNVTFVAEIADLYSVDSDKLCARYCRIVRKAKYTPAKPATWV